MKPGTEPIGDTRPLGPPLPRATTGDTPQGADEFRPIARGGTIVVDSDGRWRTQLPEPVS